MACPLTPGAGWLLPVLLSGAAGGPVRSVLGFTDCGAQFNSYCFTLGFLPLAVGLHWLLPGRRARLAWITAISVGFYALWDVRFVPLLVFVALVDYVVALLLVRSTRPKAWLIVSVVVNLGVLAIFKYAMFAAQNARSVFDLLGVPVEIPGFSIVLPVGISFYTFQTMSYTIDVYRGTVQPTRDFLKFLAFVSLFPQLVAGPIVRYAILDEQLDTIPPRLPRTYLVAGLSLFVVGLFKKVVVADSLGWVVDPMWADVASLTTIKAWTAALGFALQLYFDFSGYSDMALGIGALLGLRLPVNFNAPFAAKNAPETWSRWHITLSTFVRDYVYIPLGGNRLGRRRAMINILFAMTLIGLWHGAAWNFILWGVYSGLRVVSYLWLKPWWDTWPVRIQQVANLSLAIPGFALFRSPDLSVVAAVYKAMFFPTGGLPGAEVALWLVAFLGLLAFTVLWPHSAVTMRYGQRPAQGLLIGAMAVAALIMMHAFRTTFIYYQF